MTMLATVTTVGILLFILATSSTRAARRCRELLHEPAHPVGETGGGMANAMIGSAKLLLVAAAIGVPIGFIGGVYLAEIGSGRLAFFVRYAADVLNGVPSIVIGVTVYALVVVPMGTSRRSRRPGAWASSWCPSRSARPRSSSGSSRCRCARPRSRSARHSG
jgi:phosphate transport system permease protein